MAVLALVKLPAGTRVSIDGRAAGAVRSDGTFTAQIPPGAHVIELAQEGYQPVKLERTITPGNSRIDGAAVRFLPVQREIPRPPDLPEPNPAEQEQIAWNAVQNSRNESDFTAFLKTYPGGRHAADAGRKVEQLRWERVDNNDVNAVQEHLRQFPNSQSARQALERLRRQTAQAAEQQQAAELERRLSADRQAVKDLLNAYAAAYENRDYSRLGELRPPFRASIQDIKRRLDRYRSVKASFVLNGEPEIRGDSATVRAVFQTETVDAQQRRPDSYTYVVTCVRRGAGWVIESMQ
jgi:hypothetical protein